MNYAEDVELWGRSEPAANGAEGTDRNSNEIHRLMEKLMNEEKFVKQAEELVSKMTLEEVASQLLHQSPAIERLGVPEYNWWSEALHGVARAGIATVYPQAIGMAATFDPDFLEKEAETIALEARAKYNAATKHGDRDIYKGLTYWSPNINIFRDPRWGRGHETYGEDPYLTSTLGNRFINGLQGDTENEPYMKIAACAKHFAVHSGPEALRHSFDAQATEKDLQETYLPAFESAVKDAHVEAVMGAYNRTNGEPCCAHERLLVQILRGEWGFHGHVVSDCWAVKDIHKNHHYTNTPEESAAIAVKRGCDLNCGCTFESLLDAHRQGLISEEEIRRAAVHVFTTRFKLGEFADDCKYDQIPYDVVECREHRNLALQAAEKSMVLLSNRGMLPMDVSKLKSIAVIGPNAYSTKALYGNYNGFSSHWVTNLDGIREYVGEDVRVYYSEGCDIIKDQEDNLAKPGKFYSEAQTCAEMADAVVLCVGLDGDLEGEEGDTGNSFAAGDKVGLLLPQTQQRLIEAVLAVGKPTVIVVNSGSALDLSAYEDRADAILQAWYSGARGGEALANILFGKVAPSGKLPLTFYHDNDPIPDFTDYHMKGRTYKFFTGTPWRPFGFGLSYTKFEYRNLHLKKTADNGLEIEFELANIGDRDGDEIAQVYLSYDGEAFEKPIRKLVGFARRSLKKGEVQSVTMQIRPQELLSVLEDGSKELLSGTYRLSVGGSQPDALSTLLVGAVPLEETFSI